VGHPRSGATEPDSSGAEARRSLPLMSEPFKDQGELKLRPPKEKDKPKKTQAPTFPVKGTGTHRRQTQDGHLKVAATKAGRRVDPRE
jgi:hypothetical protein